MALYTPHSTASPIDLFFNDFLRDRMHALRETAPSSISPQYRVFEADNTHHIDIELPGVAENNVQVDVSRDSVSIRASREVRTVSAKHSDASAATNGTDEGAEEHKTEVPSSKWTYSLKVGLPRDADTDNVTAKLEHGLLQIVVPHRGATESRRITLTKM